MFFFKKRKICKFMNRDILIKVNSFKAKWSVKLEDVINICSFAF